MANRDRCVISTVITVASIKISICNLNILNLQVKVKSPNTSRRHMWGMVGQLHVFISSALYNLSGQLQTPAALPLSKEPPVTDQNFRYQDPGQAPEQGQRFCRRNKILPLAGIRILSCAEHSLLTTLTILSWLFILRFQSSVI